MKTIDLTPTWAGLMPFFFKVLEDPDQPEKVKAMIREELMELAQRVDKMNLSAKGDK